ncbi:MAG: nicotinamide riboside transporter PnuC [Synergistaceae bacterium]|jgi:nicotinamide mononucleotide transporter|nr:nicotinamide riboside transporter PnuC [Synergistaceae bacterium]
MDRLFLLSSWNRFEKIWIAAFCATGIGLTLVWGDNLFGFTVFFSGILCVILAAKGHIWNYPVGMYNNFGYAYLAWVNGLYGEVSLYLFFFVPASIIGFFMWRRHLSGDFVAMRSLRPHIVAGIAVVCVIFIASLGYGLSMIKTQNTPYIDAVTNVLSITATLLMMWRYREQWIAYIALNCFSLGMWAVRWSHGSEDGPIMCVMWAAFLVNAFYGYVNWSKGAKISRGPVQ